MTVDSISDVDQITLSLEQTGNITSVTSAAALSLLTGAGQDEISVTQVGNVEGMYISGGANADYYQLKIYGTATGDINLDDVIATDANSAGNALVISTEDIEDVDDHFLFRNALLYRYDDAQRIDYSGFAGLSLSTYGGNDTFIFDDSNVLLTVDAGEGDDIFQLGQMYQSPRDTFAGLSADDTFLTYLTTQGYLSNGVSAAATLIGGIGDDSFTVLSNQATVSLLGGADSDNFLVRSFVLVDPDDPLAPITNINGGDGADYISYAINSPVRIAGGDGLDSLTVIGTEFADDFVVTDEGIYGLGRYTSYDGIEQIIVDGLEGNDSFFVFSTPADAELQIIGGLGSDTFNIGDGPDGDAVSVVADDLEGYNSLIEHETLTSDVIRTLSTQVMDEDEAGVRLIPIGTGNTIFEDNPGGAGPAGAVFGAYAYVQYAVLLTRPPKGVVSFSAKPAFAEDAEDSQNTDTLIRPEGILLNGSAKGVTFLFDKTNWYQERIITVTAPVDSGAFNGGIEGIQSYQIQHTIIEDGAVDGDEYDNVEVNNFVVRVVDTQTANVVVLPSQEQLVVGEIDVAAGQTNYAVDHDSYELMLSKEPPLGQPVTVNISPYVDPNTGAQLSTQPSSITFVNSGTAENTANNIYHWNHAAKITISAMDDTAVEGIHYSHIDHSITTTAPEYSGISIASVDVMIGDNEVQDIIFLETDGSTIVTEKAQEVVYVEGQLLDQGVYNATTSEWEFSGTFGLPEIGESRKNNTITTAQNLEDSEWGIEVDTDIFAPNTFPHISISGELEGSADFYSFKIDSTMLTNASNSVTVNLDVDKGYTYGDDLWWRSQLKLYKVDPTDSTKFIEVSPQDYATDYNQRFAARTDTTYLSAGPYASGGSTWDYTYNSVDYTYDMYWYDDFNTYEINSVGTYVIEVTNSYDWYYNYKEGFKLGLPDGVDYELQVSVEGHKRDAWAFAPDPILEDEDANNNIIGSNIDDWVKDPDYPADLTIPANKDADNWYTFANGNIGDDIPPGASELNIDSSTPYTTISGGGDGTVDRYNFVVNTAMLTSAGGSTFDAVNSTILVANWYKTAAITMDGDPINGQLLSASLVINKPGETSHTTTNISDYVVTSGVSLAQNLVNAINAESSTAGAITASTSGDVVTLTAAPNTAFYFTSAPVLTVKQPADRVTARTTVIDNHDGNGDILFTNATITFNNFNNLENGDEWFIQVGNTIESYTVLSSTDNLATEFDGLIGLSKSGNNLVYSGSAAAISVWVEHTRTSQDQTNTPSVTLTGIPAEIGVGQKMEVDFGSATVNYNKEDWILTIDNGGTPVTHKVTTSSTYANQTQVIDRLVQLIGGSANRNGTTLEITVPAGEGYTYSLDINYDNVELPTVNEAAAVLIPVPAAASVGTKWTFSDGSNSFTFTVADLGLENDFAESFVAAYTADANFTDPLEIDGTYILVDTSASPSSFSLRQVLPITALTDAPVVGGEASLALSPAIGDYVEVGLDTNQDAGTSGTNATVTFITNDGVTWSSNDAVYSLNETTGKITSTDGTVVDIDINTADYFTVSTQSHNDTTEYGAATINDPSTTPVTGSTITVEINTNSVVFTYNGSTWTTPDPDHTLTHVTVPASKFEVVNGNNINAAVVLANAVFNPGYTHALTITDATGNFASGDPADITYPSSPAVIPATGDTLKAIITDGSVFVVTFTFDGTTWTSSNGTYEMVDSTTDFEISRTSKGKFTVNSAIYDDVSVTEALSSLRNAPAFLVSDLTGLSPNSGDRVTVNMNTTSYPTGSPAGITVTFEYDTTAAGAWASSDVDFDLDNSGRLIANNGDTDITTVSATYQTLSNITPSNIDLYGSANIAYPASFTAAQNGDLLKIVINGSTNIDFTFDGSVWSTATSGYTLTDNSSLFVLTDSDNTQPIVVDSADYTVATEESLFEARKLTISNTGIVGQYTIGGSSASATSQSDLLDLIDTAYSANGNYEVQKSSSASSAYIYNTNDTDLSSAPTISFSLANAVNDEQTEISYFATQSNDDDFVGKLDITKIKTSFVAGEVWDFELDGSTTSITLATSGSPATVYPDLLSDLDAAFPGYVFTLDTAKNTLLITATGNAPFDVDSLHFVENKVATLNKDPDPDVKFFDTYVHDFSSESVYSGKVWTVTIDGVEKASAQASSSVNGDLPSMDTVLADLLQDLVTAGYTASLDVVNIRELTISGLNDAIVNISVNSNGVGALFDLDDVKQEKENVRNYAGDYTYDSAATAIHPLGTTTSVHYDIKENLVKTPYLIIYEMVDFSTRVTGAALQAQLSTVSEQLPPELRAGFVSYIQNVQGLPESATYPGMMLNPVKVTSTADPYIENTFNIEGTYVVEVGYLESTVYEYNYFIQTKDNYTGNYNSENLNYNYGPYNYQWRGVAPGTSYDLNVSIQQHNSNLNNQTIEEKNIRVIAGPGAGAEGIIRTFTAYENNIKVNRFEIDATASADPSLWDDVDEGSRYEVYKVIDDGTNTDSVYKGTDFTDWLAGLDDTYKAVLTKSADGITVTDLDTPTYDASRAFTDGGAGNSKQTTSTPDPVTPSSSASFVVTVTADDDNTVDGGDLQVFAPAEQRVNQIRGPISIEGGAVAASYVDLNDPVMLPGETNNPVVNGQKSSNTTGSKDGTLTTAGIQIELATPTTNTITRAELEAFLAQPELTTTVNYQVLREFLTDSDKTGITEFATFVDETVTNFDQDDGEVQGFDPRINGAPYELGFIDKTTRNITGDVVDILAVIGNRVILAATWPTGYDSNNDEYYYRPLNRNERVVEEEQVDVLNFNNSGSPAEEFGILTAESLTGFGMGTGIELAGQDIPGGIRYANLEELNLYLGSGKDTLTIEATHAGATNIYTGAGGSIIDIKTISGHTMVNLGTDQALADNNLVTVSSDSQLVDQIMALLTIIGDDFGNNSLIVNDSGDTNDNTLWLTDTTLTGLDMPSVPETFLLNIQAEAGTYHLSTDGGITYELLNWDATDSEIAGALAIMTGEPVANINITTPDQFNDQIKQYQISFIGESAGKNIAEIAAFIPTAQPIAFANQFTLTTQASSGTYQIASESGSSAIVQWDANETDIANIINTLLNVSGLSLAVELQTNPGNGERKYIIDIAPRYNPDNSLFEVPAFYVSNVGTLNTSASTSSQFNLIVDNVDGSYVLLARGDDGAISDQVVLESTASDADMKVAVAQLLLIEDDVNINVNLSINSGIRTYVVDYTTGTVDFTDLEAQHRDLTISDTTPFAPRARVNYLTEGTTTPELNTVQTISVGSGNIVLTVYAPGDLDHTGIPVGSVTFSAGDIPQLKANPADADTWFDELNYLFNPNNTQERRQFYPETDNFSVVKADNDFIFTFQGEYAGYSILATDINDIVGDTELATRTDGINYYGIDTLTINTGSGTDTINVQATSLNTVTNINTGVGDEQFHVSSTADGYFVNQLLADGNLDGVQGELNIDAGVGNNALFISDFDNTVAKNAQMSDGSISGLAVGTINYDAAGGDFNNGLVVWAGKGDDTITVSSIEMTGITITELYANEGNDDIIITATDNLLAPAHNLLLLPIEERRIQIWGNAGADVIDASTADLAVRIRGGNDEDIIKGGDGVDIIYGDAGDDIIFGGDGNDYLYGEILNADPLIDFSNDIIFGDHGAVDLITTTGTHIIESNPAVFDAREVTLTDVLYQTRTTVSVLPGDDQIIAGQGDNVVLGGGGIDTIISANGTDHILGDQGIVTYSGVAGAEKLSNLQSYLGEAGGNDSITLGSGDKVVIAGLGEDTVTTTLSSVGTRYVVGDEGEIGYDANNILEVAKSTSTAGGADTLTLGGASATDVNVVIGGVGGDDIDTGDSTDYVMGDNGEIQWTGGIIDSMVSLNSAFGGNDDIDLGNGSKTVIAGMADDTVDTGTSGIHRVIGDNGEIVYATGALRTVKSTANADGGQDTITLSGDVNQVIGGSDDDTITVVAATSTDHVVGDNGVMTYTGPAGSEQLINLQSYLGEAGGNDSITLGSGDKVVIAGLGEDTVTTTLSSVGTRYVVGDEGEIGYDANNILEVAKSTSTAGGADTLTLGGASATDVNVVIGGVGGDDIDTGDSTDYVMGDNGEIQWTGGIIDSMVSLNSAFGGNDDIDLGNGSKTVIAGMADDTVDTGTSGIHRVIGDNGEIVYATGALRTVKSTANADGGQDTITLSGDVNQVIGGSDDDTITVVAATSTDHVVGDNGVMTYTGPAGSEQLINLQSYLGEAGGNDSITLGSGDKVVIAGLGEDTVTTTLSSVGTRYVVGDEGEIGYDANNILEVAKSTSTAGGADTLTLGGASATDVNVVIGGVGGDDIDTGDSTDYVMGDNGEIQWTGGIIDSMVSLNSAFGGNDDIDLGNGSKTVIAGMADDTVDTGTSGIHRVIGDNGEIVYATGALRTVKSTANADGGQDTITLSGDVNQVIGGSDDDTITVVAATSTDHVVGDNGVMTYTGPAGSEQLINMQSYLGEAGGNDSITLGSGDKVVIAGLGEDTVTTTLSSVGTRYVVGDEGEIGYDANNILEVAKSTSTAGGADTLTLGGASATDVNVVIGGVGGDDIDTGDSTDYVMGDNGEIQWTAGIKSTIFNTESNIGGNDNVTMGDGDKVVIGGGGADTIESGAGNSIYLGDNGTVRYGSSGERVQVESELSALGGDDIISVSGGNNLVFAGVGDDQVTIADGDNIIFGDNGIADYINGLADEYFTTDTNLTTSGDDTIDSGAGNDLVIGGLGNELVFTGAGKDIVIGDLGIAVFNLTDSDPNTLDMVESLFSDNGGEDEVHGGEDDDVIIGGAAADELYGDEGSDFISGDGGRATFINGQLVISETTELFIGDDDVLDGGDGNDSMFGGFGNDLFNAVLSDDILSGEYAYLTQNEDDGEVIAITYLAQGSLDLLAATTSGLYENKEEENEAVGNLLAPLNLPDVPEEIDEDTGTIYSREGIIEYQSFIDTHSYEYINVDETRLNSDETENQQLNEVEGGPDIQQEGPDETENQELETATETTNIQDPSEIEDSEPGVPEEETDAQEDESAGANRNDLNTEGTTFMLPAQDQQGLVIADDNMAEYSDSIVIESALLAGLTGWKLTNGERKGNIRIDQKGIDKLHHKQRKVRYWDENSQCFLGDEDDVLVSHSEWENALKRIRLN